MLINDIKTIDEKTIIITKDQILKALGLSSKKYELYDVFVEDKFNQRIVIQVRAKDKNHRNITMDLTEIKTLDTYFEPKLENVKMLEGSWDLD